MPLLIVAQGENNRIDINPEVIAKSSGVVNTVGNNNTVVIEAGCTLEDCNIKLVEHCSFHACASSGLAKLGGYAADNGHVRIGAECWFAFHTRLYLHEPASIIIGDRCLIASKTLITVSDMHEILDMDSGDRINPAQTVTIEEGVWLGEEVAVMKGALIGAGSAVGFRSVVTATIPPNSLAVGIPARVIRDRITWR